MDVQAALRSIGKRREKLVRGTPQAYRQYVLNPDIMVSVALSGRPPYWREDMDQIAQQALDEVLAEIRGEEVPARQGKALPPEPKRVETAKQPERPEPQAQPAGAGTKGAEPRRAGRPESRSPGGPRAQGQRGGRPRGNGRGRPNSEFRVTGRPRDRNEAQPGNGNRQERRE